MRESEEVGRTNLDINYGWSVSRKYFSEDRVVLKNALEERAGLMSAFFSV